MMKTGMNLVAMVAAALALAACGDAGREVDDGPDYSTSLLQIVPPTFVSGAPPEKNLLLTWDDLIREDGAVVDFYRFYINEDGVSGFEQFGADIVADKPEGYLMQVPISIHLFDWENALFMLEACIYDPAFPADPDNADCAQVALQSPRDASDLTVGQFSAPSPYNNLDATFGYSIAISDDGLTLAIGAPTNSLRVCEELTQVFDPELPVEGACEWRAIEDPPEDPPSPSAFEDYSDFKDINFNADGTVGDGVINVLDRPVNAGAVFIYSRAVGTWEFTTVLHAPNRELDDNFGWAVALDDTGTRLAVTALGEDSADGDPENNDSASSGAVYVYDLVGEEWVLDSFLKASNIDDGDFFGWDLAFSGNGEVLAVSSPLESSDGTDEAGNDLSCSGAVYTFERDGLWQQTDLLKAPVPQQNDIFGQSLALDYSGTTLAVGKPQYLEEAGLFFTCDDDVKPDNNTGSAHIFERSGSTWAHTAEVFASNAENNDRFGIAVALNPNAAGDGIATRLVVGASGERGGSTGVNGPQGNDNLLPNSGAAYLFENSGGWAQTNYFKASNTGATDQFGLSVLLNDDGTALAVGAPGEAGIATGINGPQEFDRAPGAGAAYVFLEDEGMQWSQVAYVKPSLLRSGINFGADMAFAQGGSTLVISAPARLPGLTGSVFVY